ncbi:TPA: type-F conjugative transfer system mating-pair stabilization protein TraN [Vibrio cholerae]
MALFRPFLLITALALTHFAYANNQEKQYKDNVNWAQSAQQNITSKASGQLSIEDLCSDAQCVHQANNPPQKSLDDSSIESQKVGEFYSNENAGAIQDNFDKGRPNVKNDPSFEFALIGQENAFEITHGISNKYVDCNSGTQCVIEYTPRSCNSPTNNLVPCEKVPVASVVVADVSFSCPSGHTLQGELCILQKDDCRYERGKYGISMPTGQGAAGGIKNTPFLWEGISYRTSNNEFWSGRYANVNGHLFKIGAKVRNPSVFQICKFINIQIPVIKECPAGYDLSGGNCIRNEFSWKTECSLINDCKNVVSEVCIEGKETRIINGVPTTLDCWKYQVNHKCDLADSCQSLPADCETTTRSCSLMQNGVCIEEELKKSCPKQSCSTTNLVCGETSFCLDGDCYNPMPKHNTEFDKSAAALAGLNAAAKDLGDPPTMFRGKPMKCTDGVFGFADCCKNRGWGTDLGLAQCDEEEKALGQAKEKKLTIDLGSYCAERVLGKCIRRKKTYCVYDSKMARIIQEQGNKNQLNSNFGSAKDPVCNPITPEQLQSINFEHIDFSDFYEDMHTNMELPDMEEIKNRLQSAFED